MRRTRWLLSTICFALAFPAELLSQGALSTQGFGYPPGQVSTRVRGTGGALAELDPDSPLNPASIAMFPDARMYLQYEPEYRRLTRGGAVSNTLTARFSLASASVPFARRGSIGVSYATLLDRSSESTLAYEQDIGGDPVNVTETTRTLGSINDLRLAAGYAVHDNVQIGAAGHVYTGQNQLVYTQVFPDSLRFVPFTQASTVGFRGFAASVGLVARPSSVLRLAVSARKGFDIQARSGDSVLSEAKVPDRFAAGVTYEGIPGSSVSAHVVRELWSAMNGLGSSSADGVDSWGGGAGIETLGPRLAARQTVLRLGARYGKLPFRAAGSEINEVAFGGGVGIQFFRNRAAFDVSAERASRSPSMSSLDASESGYIFSFGLRVRP